MKKNTKIIIASLSLLSAFAVATPSVANADSMLISPKPNLISANTTTKDVKISVTKTGSTEKSEAGMFMGDSVKVSLDGNKVTGITVHLDSSRVPMAKGQDLSKVITSLTINGVKGEAKNVAQDGSSLDFVFPGNAYKEGKGTLTVTLNAMGKTMTESADITFDKAVETPAKPDANKDGKKDTKKPAKKNNKKVTKKAKKASKKTTKKSKATKRTLKHNAYIYGKNAKRVNKKVLKKNHKVNTYGKAIKLHGKYFYRIAKNQYVKKANF